MGDGNVMGRVPEAAPVLTPAQYGAEPAVGEWPINPNGLYAVNRIYPTIQGEGALAGTPMTIVRLQGCPVGCVFCDTPESWKSITPDRPASLVAHQVSQECLEWALITGGEPCWHNLDALSILLHLADMKTALETSGAFPLTGSWDWICVSPKPKGIVPLDKSVLKFADEVKWLVGRKRDVEDFGTFLDDHAGELKTSCRRTVQPISCAPSATKLCIEAAFAHDWYVSVQTHKLLGIA